MPRKPLGKPLPRANNIPPAPSEQELDAAVARWNANCPPWAVGLMEAEPIEKKGGMSKFIFDRANRRYIVRKTGKVIPWSEVQKAFAEYQRKVSGR